MAKKDKIVKKDEKQEIATNGRFFVDNRVIKARYGKLTDTEFRLIFTIISKIKKEDVSFRTYEYSAGALLRELGISDTNYTYLFKVLKDVFEKSIAIPDGNGGFTLYHWLETAKVEKNGRITIRFNDDLKPFFLQLQNRFTQIGFRYFSVLPTVHHRRIYMFCKEALGINHNQPSTLTMAFQELRAILELPKTYESAKYLKRDILGPAVDSINERTDIKIALEYTKAGKTHTGIKIFIIPKPSDRLPALPVNITQTKKISPEYILQFIDRAEMDRENKNRASRIKKFLKLSTADQTYWTGQMESDLFKGPMFDGIAEADRRQDLLIGFASLLWQEDKNAKAARQKEAQTALADVAE